MLFFFDRFFESYLRWKYSKRFHNLRKKIDDKFSTKIFLQLHEIAWKLHEKVHCCKSQNDVICKILLIIITVQFAFIIECMSAGESTTLCLNFEKKDLNL